MFYRSNVTTYVIISLFSVLLIFLFIKVFLFLAYAFAAGVPWRLDEGFERGNLDQLKYPFAMNTCCEHSINVVEEPVRSGRYAAKFHVTTEDPFVEHSIRSEIRARGTIRGASYWYAYSVYLPSPWIPSQNVVLISQWHGIADRILFEQNRKPPLGIKIKDDEIFVELILSKELISRSFWQSEVKYDYKTLYRQKLQTDVWLNWVIHARWTPTEDGVIEIWKDGIKIVEYKGPNMHRDIIAPFFNFGVYVPDWNKDVTITPREKFRTAFFDDIFTRKGEYPLEYFLKEYENFRQSN